MTKIFRLLMVFLACLIAVVIIHSIVEISNAHKATWDVHDQYTWLFKDSIRKEIKSDFSYSFIGDNDVYNNYHYKDLNIVIWEFKNQKRTELKNIGFNQNINFSDERFYPGEILNAETDLEIAIRLKFVLTDSFSINFSPSSKIENRLLTNNYYSFFAEVVQFSLANAKNEHQIIFDFTEGLTKVIIVFYKAEDGFYLIVINSQSKQQQLKEQDIEILNLQ